MKLVDQHILIISNEPWDGIWYSKHHYALTLSKSNTVYFLNPAPRWSLRSLFAEKFTLKKINSSLSSVDYTNCLPLTGKSDLLFKINERIIASRIKRFLKIKLDIIWSFDPYRFFNPRLFEPRLSLYHKMDDYKNKRENILIQNVDLVLTVSEALKQELDLRNKSFVVSHGVSTPFKNLKNTSEFILLAGTLSDRVDFNTVYKLAKSHVDELFKLVGPIKAISAKNLKLIHQLKQLPNVEFTGNKSYTELEKYITKSKICLCLYKQNQRGNQLDSLKILQYLIQGKPVITTYLSSHDTIDRKKLVYMAQSQEEFINFVNEALNKKELDLIVKERINFAKQFSYEKNLKLIEQYINES